MRPCDGGRTWYVIKDNAGIIERRRDELLAEAWKYGREKPSAPSWSPKTNIVSSPRGSINKEITDRWDRQLPKNHLYEWDEIDSITTMQQHFEPIDER